MVQTILSYVTFVILPFIAVVILLSFPLVMIWGWVRWARRKNTTSLFSILSLIGFVLATLSESVAILTVIYGLIKPFAFYDPTLMRIYAAGALLSLVGLILAIVGVWRPSSLRWLALGCAVGTLLFWFVQAANE